MESPEPQPRHRPRISLLSLLLITALAATSLSSYLLWSEVGPLRREVRRLRDEMGVVSVTNATRPHAIQVDTGDRQRWKWRVWIPEGRRYHVAFVNEAVPANGFPTGGEKLVDLDSGEHVLEYTLEPDPAGDGWFATAKTATAVRTSRVGWGAPQWFISHGVAQETQNFDPSEPFVLWRRRVSDDANPKSIAGPTDGFMIWLEPR